LLLLANKGNSSFTMPNRYNVPDLSPREMEQLSSLRRLVEGMWDDELAPCPGSLQAREHNDDGTLLRFIQARPTIEASAEMFRESMAWREEVDIKSIHAKYYGPSKSRAASLVGDIFYGTLVSPPSKPPIMFDRLGAVDMAGIAKESGMEDAIIECYTAYLEETWIRSRAVPGGRGKVLVVVDLKGLSMSHISNLSLIKKIAKVGPPIYPETTSCVAIIRGPWVLSAIWKVINPILPANTRAKIKIFGSQFLNDLRGMMPEDHIPTFLGGTCWVGEDPSNPASAILHKSSKVVPGSYGKACSLDERERIENPPPPPSEDSYTLEPVDIADVDLDEVPGGNIRFLGHRNSIAVNKEVAAGEGSTLAAVTLAAAGAAAEAATDDAPKK